MKRILVPTDFSEHAEYALKVAAQIARKTDAEIYLLHMLELPNQTVDAVAPGSEVPEVMFYMKKAHERFEELKEQDYLSGISVTEAVQFDRAFEGILKISKKHEIDIIVMGSHGASGFEEIFIGSNTEKVVRTSDIPVLVIKKGDDNFNIKNIVFASDFTDEIKKPFEKAVEFAALFGAHIHLLMVNTPNDFKSTSAAEKIMTDFVRNYPIGTYSTHIYNETNVEKGILKFSKSINADLIGVSTHGRKGLNHFFNGSISEDIVNHASRNVITFKI